MAPARRVLLGFREPLPEEALLARARALPVVEGALRPGDEVGGLVVLGVEPAPGDAASADTVFEIRAQPFAPREARLDVAVLLDASASMAQPWSGGLSRLEAAKDALRAFLDEPGRPVRTASVLAYAREPRLLAGPVGPGGADAGLEEVAAKGPAHTADALDAALAHLAGREDAAGTPAILLLSDGAGQAKRLAPAGERAARLGVPVHVLSFAPEVDPLFAQLAEVSGGTAQAASFPPRFMFVHEESR